MLSQPVAVLVAVNRGPPRPSPASTPAALVTWPSTALAARFVALRSHEGPNWSGVVAANLLALSQSMLLSYEAELHRAEPKTLRYWLLHIAARIIRGWRKVFLRLTGVEPAVGRWRNKGSRWVGDLRGLRRAPSAAASVRSPPKAARRGSR